MCPRSLRDVLRALHVLLRSCILECERTAGLPEEALCVTQAHALSCLGVEEVIQDVERYTALRKTAARDCRRLEDSLHGANQAPNRIRELCKAYSLRDRFNHRRQRLVDRQSTSFIVQLRVYFSHVTNAINQAILLIAMSRLDDRVDGELRTTLSDIVQSASLHTISRESGKSSTKALLKPSVIAFIQSVIQQAHQDAHRLAFEILNETRMPQMLNVDLLARLLKGAIDHPSHAKPRLVSHDATVMIAARSGNIPVLLRLLRDRSDCRYDYTVAGLVPIFFAIEHGHLETVRLLLRHGVRPNDEFGRTRTSPLAAALQSRNLPIVKLLLEYGASSSYRNSYGWSVLFFLWFREDRSKSIAPLLLWLRKVLGRKRFKKMHKDVYDRWGWNIMHRAAIYGSSKDIPVLISLGLNPFVVTRLTAEECEAGGCRNGSVLQLAVEYGLIETVEVLLPYYVSEYGDVGMPDADGWTLLHTAVREQDPAMTSLLIAHGADKNAITKPVFNLTNENIAQSYSPISLAELNDDGFMRGSLLSALNGETTTSLSTSEIDADLQLNVPSGDKESLTTSSQRSVNKHPHSRSRSSDEIVKTYGNTRIAGRANVQLGDYYNKIINITIHRHTQARFSKIMPRQPRRRAQLDNG